MTEFLQTLLSGLNYLAVNIPWEAVVAGGVLSPLAVGVNKLIKAQKPITKFTVVFMVAVLGCGINYILNTPVRDPSIIALQGAVVTFFAQPFYLLMVKPGFAWVGVQLAKAQAFDAEVKSAATPLVVTTSVPTVSSEITFSN